MSRLVGLKGLSHFVLLPQESMAALPHGPTLPVEGGRTWKAEACSARVILSCRSIPR
jgi:hypothetical protein